MTGAESDSFRVAPPNSRHERTRVVFVGAGAGEHGGPSSEGSAELGIAERVLVEPGLMPLAAAHVPTSSAVVDEMAIGAESTWAHRRVAVATLHRLVADPLSRARVEIDGWLRAGALVSLVPGIDARPLAGRRVLVTRAADQADAMAELLEARGAEPVRAPVLVIEPPRDQAPLDAALSRLDRYDWLVFTSANGVARFFDALRARGRDARALSAMKIAVIGPGTGAALLEHSLSADCVAAEHHGEGLVAALLPLVKAGQHVLLPRAAVAREVVPDSLREAGLEVDVVPVYETVAPPIEQFLSIVEELRAGAIDAVTLTSSSTAKQLVGLIGAAFRGRNADRSDARVGSSPTPQPTARTENESLALLSRLVVASIGPVTTQTAQELGLRVDVSASPHTLPGLVDALERTFQKLRPAAV